MLRRYATVELVGLHADVNSADLHTGVAKSMVLQSIHCQGYPASGNNYSQKSVICMLWHDLNLCNYHDDNVIS